MPEYKGYRGKALELLKRSGVGVGDYVKAISDITRTGIIMPRYEHGDDSHIVLKLDSGYNVGLGIEGMAGMEMVRAAQKPKPAPPSPSEREGLPRILLLSTGGTIASRVDYRTGAVTPALTAEELNSSVPELAEIANIDAKVVLSEYSENIMPKDWLDIAGEVARHAESRYAGIIIAHGTDTMHYTSAFLSFALSGFPMPVVMVGSQRSSDRASSDAALNLVGAARLITEAGTPGVFVAMHHDESDEAVACHLGTRVRKNHTSKRGAFETVGGSPAFVITQSSLQKNMEGSFYAHKGFSPRIALDTKVALVKYHPGYDPALIGRLVGDGYRGIIFEGTGLGHVGRVMYDAVRDAGKRGVFMGMTSQCLDGRVGMTVYESGRDLLDLGIIPLGDMIPEVALVKAMWVMGNFKGDKARDIMLGAVASEISG